MSAIKRTLGFINSHPLASRHLIQAYLRFINWQLKSRFSSGFKRIPFLEGTFFLAKRQLTGITGNTYSLVVTPNEDVTYTLTSVTDAFCTNNRLSSSTSIKVTQPIPPVRLPTVTVMSNQPVELKGRFLGSTYTYQWSPSTGLINPRIYNPIFRHNRETEYLISMTAPSGCVTVDTMLVRVYAETNNNLKPNLWVPTAWSPNGDGYNDLLFPFHVNIIELKYFRVFNRWGELVFETNQLNHGWNGIYKGAPQVMDTYTWTVHAIGIDGTVFKFAGNAVLLR